ncbi:MAG: hypothetical protein ACRBBQ_00250 [Cognatishimia sp.]
MFRFLCLLLFLSACSSPGPNFWQAEATRMEVGGSSFDMRRNGDLVEIIRVNFEKRPVISDIARKAEFAIETQTGCPVTEFRGDVALLVGTIDCNRPLVASEVAKFKPPKRKYLECVQFSGALATRAGDLSMQCS